MRLRGQRQIVRILTNSATKILNGVAREGVPESDRLSEEKPRVAPVSMPVALATSPVGVTGTAADVVADTMAE